MGAGSSSGWEGLAACCPGVRCTLTRAPLFSCFAAGTLKALISFEQGAWHFHLALGLTNRVASLGAGRS